MSGSARIIRGDARHLPLADNTIDLIVTSPPYFALRSYTDNGQHYAGQIGSEATPAEYVDALLDVTRECVRVLKPSGSLWVNLGDKYANAAPSPNIGKGSKTAYTRLGYRTGIGLGIPTKSLMGIPWRYALACIDQLGLILRAEIIWNKPNGLPESVQDRVRRSHEQWFHFVLQPRYFSAVDEIREGYAPATAARYRAGYKNNNRIEAGAMLGSARGILDNDEFGENPLGKLPGSVWTVKEDLWDHVLSGPMHFCPRCGRDLTAGPSLATTTPTAMPPNTSPESASDARLGSSMKSPSGPSPSDSPLTISAATRDASILSTLSPSPSKKTSDGETKRTGATTAQPDTSTTSGIPTSGATESASVACVCETGLPPIENGSVWVVPTEPLTVPAWLGVDHFAAFPLEWPRRIIQGWCPAEVCTQCGEGRRPVADITNTPTQRLLYSRWREQDGAPKDVAHRRRGVMTSSAIITGYACACTPHTDYPERRAVGGSWHDHDSEINTDRRGGGNDAKAAARAATRAAHGPVREYHFDQWTPALTTPGVVLDPFGGTGTTTLAAKAWGRTGIHLDMSNDYNRIATWRTTDRDQLAKAMQVTRSESARDADLFDMEPLWEMA
jgi:DNA modification methylase